MNYNADEEFRYSPIVRSDTQMMYLIFSRYEKMIRVHLLKPRPGLDVGVQKATLQGMPRPPKYGGSSNIVTFDDWITTIVRWFKAANICGPERVNDENGELTISSTDVQRTTTIGTFLDGDAKNWYNDVIDNVNWNINLDDDYDQYTFIDVIKGLYRRFIH